MSTTDLKELISIYSNGVRLATAHDKVFKDECAYSFDTTETAETGLYVCLNTFVAVSREYLNVHYSKCQSHLYLRIKTLRKQVQQPQDEAKASANKPSRFGLGVEGGFDLNERQFVFETQYSLFVYPEERELVLNGEGNVEEGADDIDARVRQSVQSVIRAESQALKEELACQASAWDGEKRFVTKHATNLLQLPEPPQISPNPANWKCQGRNILGALFCYCW